MQLKLSYGQEVLLSQFAGTGKATVRNVMRAVKSGRPDIYERWCDAAGNIRQTLTIFVNGDHIRYRDGLETPVEEGD